MKNENDYISIMTDINNLIDGFDKSNRQSQWKSSVKNYEMHIMCNSAMLSEQLRNRTYHTKECKRFVINERGKTRVIKSNAIEDR